MLVDAQGNEVLVRVATAELMPRPALRRRKATQDLRAEVEALPIAIEVPKGWDRVIPWIKEVVVNDGQAIEVVGAKTREAADDSGAILRETPWRTVIGGGEVPVLIFP